jgi:AP2 domain
LDDTKLTSPGGLFLSPNPPTPYTLRKDSFEEKKRDDVDGNNSRTGGGGDFEGKPSPRGGDRERYVATPTDFALDYGKGHTVSGSFDTSNVLAWLQSPTANGLFSPGGLGSIMNTPAGGGGSGMGIAGAAAAAASRTPRTPTVSTSFFFSDVASLPRNENVSPKCGGAANGGDASGNKRSQKGQNNIICISPLASRKPGNGTMSTSNTPMNYKDVFASPKAQGNLPLLSDTPSKEIRVPQRSGSKDPSLDAHLAERDLMEDEDLSVLLQLASNTPGVSGRSAAASSAIGGPVFRSPNRGRKGGDGGLPGLQLPMIGNAGDAASKTRLTQKSSRSRDFNDSDDFAPPQLGMRSSSSKGAKTEINSGKQPNTKEQGKQGEPYKRPKKVPRKCHYQMPQYPPLPHDTQPYYPHMTVSMSLPPGLNVPPGPQGAMRVIVGGPRPPPPPTSGVSKGSPPRPGGSSSHGPPLSYHDYPPPPPPPHGQGPYAHPPGMSGMYQSYPPYGGINRYQPYGQYPPPGPPRHMPMYNVQHPQDTLMDPKQVKSKQLKAGGKRPAPAPLVADGKPMATGKKLKKSPNGQPPKKKNKSPQLTDGAERRKAAATIHAVNSASGGMNDKAAALAAAILRGVTMRPSGKWQAQLYFAGKSRYIGVFDTREKAALAYEIAREKLKSGKEEASVVGGLNPKSTENLVNAARKAAFEGVNERLPK